MRIIFLASFLFLVHGLTGQVSDDFSDGDLSQNPPWTGEFTLFQTSPDLRLQSNGPDSSDVIHLVTATPLLDSTEWQFSLVYDFPPSTSNQLRVYLVSDQADLEGPLQGYFLEVGESGSDDSYDLYRQDGSSDTLLIEGQNGLAGAGINARIQIRRDELGNWSLAVDSGQTGVFVPQGVAFDDTYTSSSYMGWWVKHSSTRSEDFFLDDLYVGEYLVDETPPQAENLLVNSPTELLLQMDERISQLTAEESLNYRILPSNQSPSLAQLQVDPSNILLTFSPPLQAGTPYELEVNGLADLSGNLMSSPDSLAFSVTVPDTAAFKDVIINEIFADPTPSVGLPEAEYIELFNRSEKNFDLSGWVFQDNTTTGTLPAMTLAAGAYVILSRVGDTAAFSVYGTVLAPSSFPALTNGGDALGLRSGSGELIDSVNYQSAWYGDPAKADGGYSLELIRPDNLTCPPAANWIASQASIGGTPGSQNSVFDPLPEQIAPKLLSVSVLSPQELEICFDESMDEGSLLVLSSYLLSPNLDAPVSASLTNESATCVRLSWSQNLQAGFIYELSLSGLLDCQGNALTDTSVQIARGLAAQPFDVIINEFFPDVSPAVGLPEAEFVELYNRSGQVIDLSEYQFADATSAVSLGPLTLLPGEYLILCPENASGLYQSFGKVLGLNPFPSLNNSTDSLKLLGPNGELIDYVNYSDDWYRDETKAAGGWTLERIDPDLTDCNQPANWGAAFDAAGGTPGQPNSRLGEFSDNDAPALLRWELLSPQELLLHFTEPLAPQAPAKENFDLQPNLGTPNSVLLLGSERASLRLFFGTPLDSQEVYELIFSGVGDCVGNEAIDTLLVGIPRFPEPFEVVFTELYADASPSFGLPEGEFVEIYNRSNALLDLTDYQLQDPGSQGTFPASILPPLSYAILCAERDQADYEPFGMVIPLSSFPSLNNSSDSLFLLNPAGEIVEYVFYENSWWGGEKGEGGWTLEKRDVEAIVCNQPGNWQASLANVGGTPGQVNSTMQVFSDVLAPSIAQVEILAPNEIRLWFSEQMDPATLERSEAFEISPGIGMPLFAQAQAPHFRSVQLTFDSNLEENILYALTMDGLTDCEGNVLLDSALLGIPLPLEAGDILLNEILFNPYTGGSDFVEIVNVSNKVLSLGDLWIGEAFPETDSVFNLHPASETIRLILPGELLCLSKDVAFQQLTYRPPTTARFLEMGSFPSYDDARGDAILVRGDSLAIDRFTYEDDYHFPSLSDDNGVSLERISLQRPSQTSSNWHSAASTVGYATPGYENSQAQELGDQPSVVSLEPATFSPNSDGEDDVLGIHYDFDFPGANAKVSIVDRQGRLLRVLQENILLSPQPGSFFWDGTDARGNRAPIGPYVVVFEVSRSDTGERMVYREVCVLADRL